jgi:hypothetical protein
VAGLPGDLPEAAEEATEAGKGRRGGRGGGGEGGGRGGRGESVREEEAVATGQVRRGGATLEEGEPGPLQPDRYSRTVTAGPLQPDRYRGEEEVTQSVDWSCKRRAAPGGFKGHLRAAEDNVAPWALRVALARAASQGLLAWCPAHAHAKAAQPGHLLLPQVHPHEAQACRVPLVRCASPHHPQAGVERRK